MDERGLNRELQAEEIEVLQSIYASDFRFNAAFDDIAGVRCFTVAVPGPHAIQLLVHLPLGYPTQDAPIAQVDESLGLTNAQRTQILQDLDAVFQRSNGQVCLYEWIESVREQYASSDADVAALSLANARAATEPEPDDVSTVVFATDAQTLRPRVRTAQAVRDRIREAQLAPLIVHGEPFTDRKSTFQGHACPVRSVADVRAFVAVLLDDRKVERALHNMLAYRLVGDFVIKDNDEDGEDGAGSKLAHLLELTKAENVAVVVTRWFGGVLLGPDRFRHINTAARDVLEAGGFVAAAQSQRKRGKKTPAL